MGHRTGTPARTQDNLNTDQYVAARSPTATHLQALVSSTRSVRAGCPSPGRVRRKLDTPPNRTRNGRMIARRAPLVHRKGRSFRLLWSGAFKPALPFKVS